MLIDLTVDIGAMRVIVTARQTLTPGYEQILQRLVAILGVEKDGPENGHRDLRGSPLVGAIRVRPAREVLLNELDKVGLPQVTSLTGKRWINNDVNDAQILLYNWTWSRCGGGVCPARVYVHLVAVAGVGHE